MSTTSGSVERPKVLICGSGPSGLVLALTLAKNGVPIRIIEKDREFHQGQRGSGVQPRTMEVYNFLGVADDIVQSGMPHRNIAVYKLPEGKEIIKDFSMGKPQPPTPSVPYPNVVNIGQDCAEGILRKHLAVYGIIPERSTELVDFEQDEQGVTAHLVKHDGDRTIEESAKYDYLVGADGARSIVRKKLGLTFMGTTRSTERMVVADIEIKGLNTDYWHSWGDFATKAVLIRPTEKPGVFGVNGGGKEADIDLAMQGRDGLIKYILGVTNRHDWEFGELKTLSEWRPNIRMANKFGEGKVFIVGDAAHVHSPAGGQGLNSSVQDSFNLGWKLALVCNSLAPPAILNAYTAERLPVIREMLERTTNLLDKTLKYRADGKNTEGFARAPILHQLGVHCRASPLVVDEQAEFAEARKAEAYLDADPSVLFAGDRAPDAPALHVVGSALTMAEETSLFKIYTPTRHTMLLFAKTLGDAWLQPVINAARTAPKDLIQIVIALPQDTASLSQVVQGVDLVVVDTLGHAADAYPPALKGFPIIIVRPDGVLGAVVSGDQGVNRYIQGIFVH